MCQKIYKHSVNKKRKFKIDKRTDTKLPETDVALGKMSNVTDHTKTNIIKPLQR